LSLSYGGSRRGCDGGPCFVDSGSDHCDSGLLTQSDLTRVSDDGIDTACPCEGRPDQMVRSSITPRREGDAVHSANATPPYEVLVVVVETLTVLKTMDVAVIVSIALTTAVEVVVMVEVTD
jgi:hypothetical protein